ncbi:hypothetical protein DFH08DRAFT_796908 [Mycena albidolilacea]|uniref:Uncharacterized protein n=1 Tax=Mycena albidolilacea TaxID=1033008 RepID=A0AAD7F584_9AGAR|nr:hypothetical protein DFH08DRAFT_796908 [Mycena albidolilacea]
MFATATFVQYSGSHLSIKIVREPDNQWQRAAAVYGISGDKLSRQHSVLSGNDSGIESQHFSDPSVALAKRILSDESGYLKLNTDDSSTTLSLNTPVVTIIPPSVFFCVGS